MLSPPGLRDCLLQNVFDSCTTPIVPKDQHFLIEYDDETITDDFILLISQAFSPILGQHLLKHPDFSHIPGSNGFTLPPFFHTQSYPSQPCESESSAFYTVTVSQNSPNQFGSTKDQLKLNEIIHRTIITVLHTLRQIHLRKIEVLIAITLIERIVCQPKIPFLLTKDNLSMTICVALLLAHKSSTDVPYNNKSWATCLHARLASLNASELFFLDALGYSVTVTTFDLECINHFIENIRI